MPEYPAGKREGFTTAVKETPNLTGQTKAQVSGKYIPKTNKDLMGEAKNLLNEGAEVELKGVKNLDQKIAATIQEAINLDRAGNHEAAANLLNNLSKSGTELGRGVQAFKLMDQMSPEAIGISAAGKIRQYNLTAIKKIPELTGQQQEMISEAVARIRDMAPGREKTIALMDLNGKIADFLPSSWADKAITVWKAGLLTSLRTHERNLLGNTVMAGVEVGKDIPASVADQLMALRTGQRSMTLTTRGAGEGAIKGGKAAADVVQLGFDPEEAISKFDIKRITWGNNPVERFLKVATDAVYRPLAAEDKVFWHSAYARSLYDQAGAAAVNAGKQGSREFVESLVKKPTEEMLTTALKDANYATFHDKNMLSGVASAIKRVAQDPKYDWGAEAGKVVTEVLMPFTGVPSSIVGKTVAYSPVGLVKGIMDTGKVLVKNVPELQRQAAQEVGRGVMGTGLFGLGAYLMSKGLMTGQPKDLEESTRWALEGKQANSVLVGGKWRNINSVGPQFLIALAGAKAAEEMGKPEGSVGDYAAGIGKDQLEQTFLKGVQGPLMALSDPGRYGKNYLNQQVASLTPNIVKDVSKVFDPYQRETNTVKEAIQATIPGQRNKLLPKRDVLGNIIPQSPTGLAAMYDIFNSKETINDPVVKELGRLAEAGTEGTPSKMSSTMTKAGVKIKLTPEALDSLEAGIGTELRPRLQVLINSPAYQKLSDDDKASAIDGLVSTIRTAYKKANVGETGEITGESLIGYQTNDEIYAKWSELNKKNRALAYQYQKKLTEPQQTMIETRQEDEKMGVTSEESDLRNLGVANGDRAAAVAKILKPLPKGSSARAAMVNRLKKIKVITTDVYRQLLQLQREGKF